LVTKTGVRDDARFTSPNFSDVKSSVEMISLNALHFPLIALIRKI